MHAHALSLREDTFDEIPGPYARPRGVPRLEDCAFYHSVDLPGHGFQPGLWDLRGNVDAYFGHVDVAGKRVLEVGTANGFLRVNVSQCEDERLFNVLPSIMRQCRGARVS